MNKLELIEKYIQDSASPTEMAAIKKLMSEDEAFKKEVHFHLALRMGVQQEERSRLKEQLQAIEHSKSRLNWKTSLGKVAAMLLLSVGVIWLFLKPSKHEKLYDKYFEPYTNIVAPTVRGSNSYSENVKIAFNYYDQGAYDKAAVAFENIYRREKIDFANFYYGVSLMAKSNIQDGILALSNPNWVPPQNLKAQTDWYLALGHLKLGNLEKAKEHLLKVTTNTEANHKNAQQLLEEIKK